MKKEIFAFIGRLCFVLCKVGAGNILELTECVVGLAKALHTMPNYLLMGESDEDLCTEDMLNILEKIAEPAREPWL